MVDLTEGRAAKYFSLNNIPSNLSSTIKVIIEEFILKYQDLKKQGIV